MKYFFPHDTEPFPGLKVELFVRTVRRRWIDQECPR